MECEHELATKVVLAVIFENGKMAQFVIISTRGAPVKGWEANCPNRSKRGEEAEQKVLSCLV